MFQYAKLDAIRVAQGGACRNDHAVRVRAGRRRGKNLDRPDLPHAMFPRRYRQRIHRELCSARLPATDRAGACSGFERSTRFKPRWRSGPAASGAKPRVCRTAARASCRRPQAGSSAEKAQTRGAACANGDGARAAACRGASLALATRTEPLTRSGFLNALRLPNGRPQPFGFLDTARTGSLQRSRSGD
jgi:hypothetical protein